MSRFREIFYLFMAAVAALLIVSNASAQDSLKPDYSKVTQVPREAVDTWLKNQVLQSNGEWDTDRYSFYIGFSTGGFGTDPVSAIAMSRLAFGLMNNSLAIGDRITPIAWELKDEKIGPSSTLTDDVKTRAMFVDNVPYAPRSDTRGGHDIEQTLYDTIKHVPSDEQSSSIILLLTGSDHSQAATRGDTHLFGADNPLLINALRSGNYREPTHAQFKLGSKDGDVTVYIIGLFPKKLVSLESPMGPRYPTFARSTWQPSPDAPGASEKLPNDVLRDPGTQPPPHTGGSGPPPPPSTAKQFPWLILALIAAIVAIVIIFMVMSKRSGVQRPLPPVAAAVTPATAKVETIPGSLRVIIGPDEQTLTPLARNGKWELTKGADGKILLVDMAPADKPAAAPAGAAPALSEASSPAAGTTFAKLAFSEDRTLRAEFDSGAQFAELQGTAADQCDSRTLKIEPGKRVLCRVQPPDAGNKIRFEIVYDTQGQKGSKA